MSKPPAPSDIADKFMLRLPAGMRDRLAEVAKANKRSMNAEIVTRLEASFPSAMAAEAFKGSSPEVILLTDKLLQDIVKRVERYRLEAQVEVEALKEENRALREAAEGAK